MMSTAGVGQWWFASSLLSSSSLLLLLLLLLHFSTVYSAVLLTQEMQTFGGALKSFRVQPNVEQLLFNFSAPPSNDGRPHTITEQWFSLFGGDQVYDRNTDARIRVYLSLIHI